MRGSTTEVFFPVQFHSYLLLLPAGYLLAILRKSLLMRLIIFSNVLIFVPLNVRQGKHSYTLSG